MKFITHPANLELLKKQLDASSARKYDSLFGAEIVVDSHLERERWSGRYRLPDGRCVARKDLRLPWGRFAEWGPEDADFLLLCGEIANEMEMLFYQLDDSFLPRFTDFLL